jgi:Carboxypeptidase regulatory-like domain
MVAASLAAGQGPKAIRASLVDAERQSTASLSIRVKDQSDGLLSDARVFLTSESTLRRVAEGQTDSSGELYFPKLQPGSYGIEVLFPGFSTPRQSVPLVAGMSSQVEVQGTLHDGAVGEVVVPPKHPVLHRVRRLVPRIHW